MTSWVSYCKETHQRVQLIGRLTKSFGKCLQPFFKVKYSMQSLGNHHFLFICFFLHRWIDHKSSASFCFTRKCFHGDYSNKRCCCECYTAKRGFTSTLNYNSSLLLCYQSCCSEKYVLGLNCVIIFVDMNVPRLSFFTKYKWEAASASCCIFHSFTLFQIFRKIGWSCTFFQLHSHVAQEGWPWQTLTIHDLSV